MTDNPESGQQPPVAQEDKGRGGMNRIVRIALKFVMGLGILAAVFWIAMSMLLNYYLKDGFEMYASGMLRMPVQIHGGIRLGKDLMKPSMVMTDIVAGLDRKEALLAIKKLEIGLPWQKLDPEKPEDVENLSFFARVGGLRVEGKDYGSYEIPIKMLKDGNYEIKDMTGRINEASFGGELVRLGGMMEGKAEAEGLDYSHFMQGAKGGKLKMRTNLSAKAEDRLADMVSSLKGTLTIAGGEGMMEDNGLTFWTGDLVKSLFSPAEKETRIKCAVADFAIDNGVAIARTFIIDTEKVTIFGRGSIDFARQQIDMVITPKPRMPALLSLATPIVIEGPFNAVTTRPDPAGVAAKVGGVLLGILAPQGAALLPFLKTGTGGIEDCARYIEDKKE